VRAGTASRHLVGTPYKRSLHPAALGEIPLAAGACAALLAGAHRDAALTPAAQAFADTLRTIAALAAPAPQLRSGDTDIGPQTEGP